MESSDTTSSDSSSRIRFICTVCGNGLRARLEKAGMTVRCPFCKNNQIVPGGSPATESTAPTVIPSAADERLRFHCSECGNRVRAKFGQEGKVFKCPFCSAMQIVPVDAKTHRTEIAEEQMPSEDAFQFQWKAKVIHKKEVSNIDKYFELVRRCSNRMQTECLRILGNAKAEREQKERLIQQQMDETYQEVRRFRDVVLTSLRHDREHLVSTMDPNSKRLKIELGKIAHFEEEMDIVFKVMFEDLRAPDNGDLPPAPHQPEPSPEAGAPEEPQISEEQAPGESQEIDEIEEDEIKG